METVLVSEEAAGRPHDTVLDCVQKTEKMKEMVPLAIIAICVLPAVLGNLIHFQLVGALLNGFVCFLVAGLLIRVVNKFFISPYQTFRYKGAAERLARDIQAGNQPIVQKRIWWQDTPGALAITRQGQLAIMDHNTRYQRLCLRPDQIVAVGVEREVTHVTDTRHGGRFTIGGLSRGGLFGGYTFGGRSRSTTRTIETAFLEIQYQLDRNGVTYITVVPFGTTRRDAEALCTTIKRLGQTA
ncbi:hypothetical protein ACLRDC_17400 [Gluconacetobacter sacchari]|uniref:hypothetical protein n=1 Tax=Gluconacetobacter sacchari TaxID=92759 RepID=UPI0039B6E51D